MRQGARRDRPEPLHPGEVVPHRLHLCGQELRHHELPGVRGADGRPGAPRLRGGAGHAELLASVPLCPDRGRDRQRGPESDAAADRPDDPGRVQGPDPLGRRDGQRAAAHSCRASRPNSASTSASTATTSRASSTTSKRSGTCSGCPDTDSSTRATTSPR
jgi:hypothetical protein